ncbi:unnamed protein product [marine sediment metagenome]|uniref:Carbohydrate kinase PfkB domain-containing protein n=1 Tax=marine sediment metagenome TaxID=412755 RepID=X1P0U0_9ZZZZ
MLDEFIWGEATRISPEAPVPIVKVKSRTFVPGGAGNVVNNIHHLGGQAFPCGVVSIDSEGSGSILRNILWVIIGKNSDGVITVDDRPTIRKTRVCVDHQQIIRIDEEDIKPLNSGVIERMLCFIETTIPLVDVILIEDYGKGVICPEILSKVSELAKEHNKIVTIDPKEDNFSLYKKCYPDSA